MILWSAVLLWNLFQPQSIVVHIERGYQGAVRISPQAKRYITARSIILSSSQQAEQIFTKHSPVEAPAGIHELKLRHPVIVMVGGYFQACFSNAVRCTMDNASVFVVAVPMRAVFAGDERSLWELYTASYKTHPEEFRAFVRQRLPEVFPVVVGDWLFLLKTPVVSG